MTAYDENAPNVQPSLAEDFLADRAPAENACLSRGYTYDRNDRYRRRRRQSSSSII